MNNAVLTYALRGKVGKTAAQRGLVFGQPIPFFVEVRGRAVSAGPATVSDAGTPGETSLRRRLENHDLPCTEESNPVVIGR